MISFAGLRDGYFAGAGARSRYPDPNSGADCLFIGMPTPRKERFLASHRDYLNVPFIMGVGGSFDILAGKVDRAPARMRVCGLEWLYRVYQEPRRMWWRYAKTNTFFCGILARAVIRRSLARAENASPRDKLILLTIRRLERGKAFLACSWEPGRRLSNSFRL